MVVSLCTESSSLFDVPMSFEKVASVTSILDGITVPFPEETSGDSAMHMDTREISRKNKKAFFILYFFLVGVLRVELAFTNKSSTLSDAH